MDRIADDLGDRAFVREHDFRHTFEVAAEQARELSGVERFHERREPGDVGEQGGDFAPFDAGRERIDVGREATREIGREIARERRVRALRRGLTRPRVPEVGDMSDRSADRGLEVGEVDRLGEEVEGAAVHRGADIGHVAVSRDNHGREAGGFILQLGEQGQPIHAGHVDVGHDHVEVAVFGEEGQRLDAVAGEAESNRPVLDLAAELLPDQILEIGLVIDDENLRRHWRSVAASSRRPISPRNSGKSIGLVKRPAAPASIAIRRVSESP